MSSEQKSVYLNDAAGSGQGSRPPSKGLSSVYLQPNQNDGIEEYDLSAAPSYYYQTYQAPSFARKDQEPAPVVEVAKEGQMSQAKPAEQQQIVTSQRTSEQMAPYGYVQEAQAQKTMEPAGPIIEIATAEPVMPQDEHITNVATAEEIEIPVTTVTAEEISPPRIRTIEVAPARETATPAKRPTEPATPPQRLAPPPMRPTEPAAPPQRLSLPPMRPTEPATPPQRLALPPMRPTEPATPPQRLALPPMGPTEPAAPPPRLALPPMRAIEVQKGEAIPRPYDRKTPKEVGTGSIQKVKAREDKKIITTSPKVHAPVEKKKPSEGKVTSPKPREVVPSKSPKRTPFKRGTPVALTSPKTKDVKQPKAVTSKLLRPKRVFSDPIVTPRTDEYPTDDTEFWCKEKAATQEKPATKAVSPIVEKPKEENKVEIIEPKPPPGTEKLQAQLREPAKVKSSATPETKPRKSVEIQKLAEPKRKADARCLSDPIVTPVSDEYPTEDLHGEWVAPAVVETKQIVRGKDDAGAVDSGKRIISNPILTPRTDEYPTLEEQGFAVPAKASAEPVPQKLSKEDVKETTSDRESRETVRKPAPSKGGRAVTHGKGSKGSKRKSPTPHVKGKTSKTKTKTTQATTATAQKKRDSKKGKKGAIMQSKKRHNKVQD